MEGLSEAINLIQDTAVKAAKPIEVSTGDPSRKTFLFADKSTATVDVPPTIRNHKIYTVGDLAKYLDGDLKLNAVIWHSHAEIVLVLDDDERRDRVTMDLTESAQFKLLRSAAQNDRLSQSEIINLLRNKLAKNCPDAASIVTKLRTIKFKATEEGGSDVQRGKESMDLSVQKEILGVADLPETVKLNVPVYGNPIENEKTVSLECYLDVDVENRCFRFAPMGTELEDAVFAAQADIRQRITAVLKDVPIYHGTP